MPWEVVQTPQMRWEKAQASRGSRPRMIISMPRIMVPQLEARVMSPLPSTSASMRRWPSMRVIGSTTSLVICVPLPEREGVASPGCFL